MDVRRCATWMVLTGTLTLLCRSAIRVTQGDRSRRTSSTGVREHTLEPIHSKEREVGKEKHQKSHATRRLPDAICIGSKKSGTGTLQQFLSLNPAIRFCEREAHFFDRDYIYNEGPQKYLDLLCDANPKQILVEKSPRYFVHEPAVRRIHALNKSTKLILILRDPIKRLISDYDFNKHMPDSRRFPSSKDKIIERQIEKDFSLEDLVFTDDGRLNASYEPVRVSMYDVHVQRYLEWFPRNQLLVLDGEQFIKDPLPLLQQCEEFLGVPHSITRDMFVYNEVKGYMCRRDHGCSTTAGRVHRTYAEEFIDKLRRLYAPHVTRLEELLDQTFQWKNAYHIYDNKTAPAH